MTTIHRYCPYQWLAKRNHHCHHCGQPIRKDHDLVARAYPNCCELHGWKAQKWTNPHVGTGNYICADCVRLLGFEVLRHQHPEERADVHSSVS